MGNPATSATAPCLEDLAATGSGPTMLLLVVAVVLVIAGLAAIVAFRMHGRRAGSAAALIIAVACAGVIGPLSGAEQAQAASGVECPAAPVPSPAASSSSTPTSTPAPTPTSTPTPTPTPTPQPFVCPTGIAPALAGNGQVSTSLPVTGNFAGSVALGALYAIDLSSVDPAVYGTTYTVTQTMAKLSMSSGQQYQATNLSAGTGTVGSVSPAPGAPVFLLVQFPSGLYGGAAVDPVNLTSVTSTYVLGFTSPSTGETISCTQTMSWTLTGRPSGRVFLGTGLLQYAGVITPAP